MLILINIYKYSGCVIGFDLSGRFLLPNVSGYGESVLIFGADMSSSVHINYKKKDIFILCKGPT